MNNLHSYSKGKDIYWEDFLKDSLSSGLRVICRILEDIDEKVQYEAYYSMIGGPEEDFFYIGLSYDTEVNIVSMLEDCSDSIFKIEDFDKDVLQEFLIEILKESDFEHE